jgi:hypothetical protein
VCSGIQFEYQAIPQERKAMNKDWSPTKEQIEELDQAIEEAAAKAWADIEKKRLGR